MKTMKQYVSGSAALVVMLSGFLPVAAEVTGAVSQDETPVMGAQVKEIQDSIQVLQKSMEELSIKASNAVARGNSPEMAVQSMISAVEGAEGQLTDGSEMLRNVDAAIKDAQDTMNDFKRRSVNADYSDETRSDFERIVKEYEPTVQRLYKVRTELTKSRADVAACKRVLMEKKDVITAYTKLGRAKELAAIMEACVRNVQATVRAIRNIGGELAPPPKQ